MGMFRRGRYANVTATLALIVALGGTSYAAISLPKNSVGNRQLRTNAVTSSKVKNGSLLSKDFKLGQIPSGPKGATGPAGPAGAQGGLSDVVTTTGSVLLLTGSQDIISLTLPAGSWMVFSHVGGAHKDTLNYARIECSINEPGGSGGDFAKLRFPPNTDPVQSLVFADINMHAAVSFAAPTTVKTTCGTVPGTDAGFDLTTRQMTAVRVGHVTAQTP